ncbi:unnamed protein product, partial [Coregonus sp. 'balchen']
MQGVLQPFLSRSSAVHHLFLSLSSANLQPLLSQSSANSQTLLSQSSAPPQPILSQSTDPPQPILSPSSANPQPILSHSSAVPHLFIICSSASPQPILSPSSANPQATLLSQSSANPQTPSISPILSHSSAVPQLFIICSSASPQPILSLSSANPQTLLSQSSAPPQPILSHLLSQSSANPQPLLSQSSANPQPILSHSSANPQPLLSQSSDIRLLVGAPYETNGHHQTGDVYKCPLGKRISLTNVAERKDKMRLGMTLTTNPKDNSFVACGPLWSYECGSSYYSTGICSRVNASFKFSKTIAPAFQRCETYMDIVIVLDGSNSIYPWTEVQSFLINILQKFYIGPGQIQVGVVQYGEKVVHEFHLNDYKSVEEVVKRASNIHQRGGEETNTALGINVARSEAFKRGARRGAKKVMIVITDGESHDSPDLQQAIEDSEKDGITRYAIAVLGYYNRRGINPEAFLNEIKYIASDPDDKHFFKVTDESALKDIVDALGDRIFSLEGTNKNGTAFGLQMSQAGFSSHFVEDGILVGAPGAYDWNGAVLKETRQGKVVPLKSSYSQEFPEELKNHGAYLEIFKKYIILSYFLLQNRFILEGALEIQDRGQNARFGSSLAPVPDLNGDGFNDVVVGAPLEDDHRGAIYVFFSQRNRILRKYKQRIAALDMASGLRYFGRSIHGNMDMDEDGLVDLAVGSLGAAVLLWSRSVVRIHANIRFEPSKINIFVKDCERGGKEVTCMSAIVCLNVTARTAIPPTQGVAITYNTTIGERRFNPRAIMDDPDKLLFQNLTLLSGEETCQHIYFHVMETTDYVRPIVFTVEVALKDPNQGPTLDDTWPTTVRTESTTDLLSWRGAMCRRLSEGGAEGSERVMEGSRRRMVVDVRLENRGENAYGAHLNITYTPNLRFSSLIVKDNSDIKIECRSEDRQRHERTCNVSAPFMRAKTQPAQLLSKTPVFLTVTTPLLHSECSLAGPTPLQNTSLPDRHYSTPP